MKVAIVLYDINDLGGIINHTEQLAFGLRDLGHTVQLVSLHHQTRFAESSRPSGGGWEEGAFGPVHQRFGWHLMPGVQKLAYKGLRETIKARDYLAKFDLVIWTIPVPTRQAANENNRTWPKLYDIPGIQLAVVHDGNLVKNTPWIHAIKHKLSGLICVHPCAYASAAKLALPRALIFNPQDVAGRAANVIDYQERVPGFLSLQTFKRWKRVDDLVRAIPYMPRDLEKHVAGGGLEQRYMVSQDKTKPEYYARRAEDPDLPAGVEESHVRIWDRALQAGMGYHGYITGRERDLLLRRFRTLIDPSWSKGYAAVGDHFNRVVVDAAMQGCIPIARNLGIASDESGKGLLFKPGENYIMIPWDATPKDFADMVWAANNLAASHANRIIENNYELVHSQFDRKAIAHQVLQFARNQPAGYYHGKPEVGTDDPAMVAEGRVILKQFFGIYD